MSNDHKTTAPQRKVIGPDDPLNFTEQDSEALAQVGRGTKSKAINFSVFFPSKYYL